MQSIADELERRGVRVLVVVFTPPAFIRMFVDENPQPFPIVSDPNREAYRHFGLGRTRLLTFFRPSVLFRFIKHILHGTRPRLPVDRDVLQLGGDFLLDAAGELVWSWPSKDPTDRPSAEEIRKAIERLRKS